MHTSFIDRHLKLHHGWRIVLLTIFILAPCPLYAKTPCLQSPKVYNEKKDVTGWVMSEKLDGIRGYWDGKHLITRSGNLLNPPPWFTKNFPPFELDGELWSGRGEFEFIQSVVLDKTPGDGWKKITYNVFEVPNQDGTFFSRLERAKMWFAAHPSAHVRIIPQTPIRDKDHMDMFFKTVASTGGEGIIVKDPGIEYHTGESPHILKLKMAKDMEGKVVAVNPGKGKYAKAMGSLTIELDSGTRFNLGTGFTDQIRYDPPRPGSVVTFKHHGFTKNGIPKFASFLRVRPD